MGAVNALSDWEKNPDQEKTAPLPYPPHIMLVLGTSGVGKSRIIEALHNNGMLSGSEFQINQEAFHAYFESQAWDARNRHPEKMSSATAIDAQEPDPREVEYSKAFIAMVDYATTQTYHYTDADGDVVHEQGYPVIVDDHGDNLEMIQSVMRMAKARGYEVIVVGMICENNDYFPANSCILYGTWLSNTRRSQ